jgi:hypothetical protein
MNASGRHRTRSFAVAAFSSRIGPFLFPNSAARRNDSIGCVNRKIKK